MEDNIKINFRSGEKRKLSGIEYENIEKEVLGVIPDLKFLREFWEYVCELEEENTALKKKLKLKYTIIE